MNLPIEIIEKIFHSILISKRISTNRYKDDLANNIVENFDNLLNFIMVNKHIYSIFMTYKKVFLKRLLNKSYHNEQYYTFRTLLAICKDYRKLLYKGDPGIKFLYRTYTAYIKKSASSDSCANYDVFIFLLNSYKTILCKKSVLIQKITNAITIEMTHTEKYYNLNFDVRMIWHEIPHLLNDRKYSTVRIIFQQLLNKLPNCITLSSDMEIYSHINRFLSIVIEHLNHGSKPKCSTNSPDIICRLISMLREEINPHLIDDAIKTQFINLLLTYIKPRSLIYSFTACIHDKDMNINDRFILICIIIQYSNIHDFDIFDLENTLNNILDVVNLKNETMFIKFEMNIILHIIESDYNYKTKRNIDIFDRYVFINKLILKSIQKNSRIMCDFLWKIANIEKLFNEYDNHAKQYILITYEKRKRIVNQLFEFYNVFNKPKINPQEYDDCYFRAVAKLDIEVVIFLSILTGKFNIMNAKKIVTAVEIALNNRRINVVAFLHTLNIVNV